MRFIRSAATTLTLAGAATLVVSVGPAFAGGPVIAVTPSVATPGTSVTFAITCGRTASTATLTGTTLGLSDQIPMTAARQIGAGKFAVTVDLPTDISPGSYSPSIDCDNQVSGTAELTVNPVPEPTPSGAPVTGDGTTSSATGGPFAAGGLGLLAAGGLAVGAGVLRKRRRAGARP
jgi:hypothetical protein